MKNVFMLLLQVNSLMLNVNSPDPDPSTGLGRSFGRLMICMPEWTDVSSIYWLQQHHIEELADVLQNKTVAVNETILCIVSLC